MIADYPGLCPLLKKPGSRVYQEKSLLYMMEAVLEGTPGFDSAEKDRLRSLLSTFTPCSGGDKGVTDVIWWTDGWRAVLLKIIWHIRIGDMVTLWTSSIPCCEPVRLWMIIWPKWLSEITWYQWWFQQSRYCMRYRITAWKVIVHIWLLFFLDYLHGNNCLMHISLIILIRWGFIG